MCKWINIAILIFGFMYDFDKKNIGGAWCMYTEKSLEREKQVLAT